jgi:HD-like signal output (HDOD) protein
MTNKVSFIDHINTFIREENVVLPVFSSAAMRVQQELVKKDPDMKVLANLISGDQSLSSQVLQLANSSFYKGLVEVSTVQSALVRLGMQEVGRITLIASAKNQFITGDKKLKVIMKKLWQHSVGCAVGARWLAKKCDLGELESKAFFAGLFHDVGKLFVLMVIEQLSKKNKNYDLTNALLSEAMVSLHNVQGYDLMKTWNLPEEYCVVARDHNVPDFDSKNLLLVLVRLANMTCRKIGIGLEKEQDLVVFSTEEAQLLDLSEIELAELEILLEDSKVLMS